MGYLLRKADNLPTEKNQGKVVAEVTVTAGVSPASSAQRERDVSQIQCLIKTVSLRKELFALRTHCERDARDPSTPAA